jgi:hypothetical protein
MVRDGNTVYVHAWYSLRLFADVSRQRPQER